MVRGGGGSSSGGGGAGTVVVVALRTVAEEVEFEVEKQVEENQQVE